jgi:hypothetical protein
MEQEMTDAAPTKIPSDGLDRPTNLRMWSTTIALQARSPNQSFEGAMKNAETIFKFISGEGLPVESSLKVVKSLDDAR